MTPTARYLELKAQAEAAQDAASLRKAEEASFYAYMFGEINEPQRKWLYALVQERRTELTD